MDLLEALARADRFASGRSRPRRSGARRASLFLREGPAVRREELQWLRDLKTKEVRRG